MKSKYKKLTISFGFPHLESIKILQFLQNKNVIKSKCQFSIQAKTKVKSDNFENI